MPAGRRELSSPFSSEGRANIAGQRHSLKHGPDLAGLIHLFLDQHVFVFRFAAARPRFMYSLSNKRQRPHEYPSLLDKCRMLLSKYHEKLDKYLEKLRKFQVALDKNRLIAGRSRVVRWPITLYWTHFSRCSSNFSRYLSNNSRNLFNFTLYFPFFKCYWTKNWC